MIFPYNIFFEPIDCGYSSAPTNSVLIISKQQCLLLILFLKKRFEWGSKLYGRVSVMSHIHFKGADQIVFDSLCSISNKTMLLLLIKITSSRRF